MRLEMEYPKRRKPARRSIFHKASWRVLVIVFGGHFILSIGLRMKLVGCVSILFWVLYGTF